MAPRLLGFVLRAKGISVFRRASRGSNAVGELLLLLLLWPEPSSAPPRPLQRPVLQPRVPAFSFERPLLLRFVAFAGSVVEPRAFDPRPGSFPRLRLPLTASCDLERPRRVRGEKGWGPAQTGFPAGVVSCLSSSSPRGAGGLLRLLNLAGAALGAPPAGPRSSDSAESWRPISRRPPRRVFFWTRRPPRRWPDAVAPGVWPPFGDEKSDSIRRFRSEDGG